MVARLSWKLDSKSFLNTKKSHFCVNTSLLVKMTVLHLLNIKFGFSKIKYFFVFFFYVKHEYEIFRELRK